MRLFFMKALQVQISFLVEWLVLCVDLLTRKIRSLGVQLINNLHDPNFTSFQGVGRMVLLLYVCGFLGIL